MNVLGARVGLLKEGDSGKESRSANDSCEDLFQDMDDAGEELLVL